jgi:hypothetical protein
LRDLSIPEHEALVVGVGCAIRRLPNWGCVILLGLAREHHYPFVPHVPRADDQLPVRIRVRKSSNPNGRLARTARIETSEEVHARTGIRGMSLENGQSVGIHADSSPALTSVGWVVWYRGSDR